MGSTTPNHSIAEKIISKIYIINMDHKTDRWDHIISDVLPKSSFITDHYERYSGIDGSKLPDDLLYSIVTTKGRQDLVSGRPSKGLYLTKGAVGLALTYKKILEACSGITLILEDDINIDNNFDNELNQCLSNLPYNWDILYLGWCDSKWMQINSINPYINILSGQVNGTHGWIINPNSVDKLLSLFPINYQIDSEIYRNQHIIKYGTHKKLVQRARFGSDIQL